MSGRGKEGENRFVTRRPLEANAGPASFTNCTKEFSDIRVGFLETEPGDPCAKKGQSEIVLHVHMQKSKSKRIYHGHVEI